MKPVHSETINSRVGVSETLQYSTSAVNTATTVVNECKLSLVLQTMLFRKICAAPCQASVNYSNCGWTVYILITVGNKLYIYFKNLQLRINSNQVCGLLYKPKIP